MFIDAYDSFSNNIISLLETNLDAEVHAVKIDDKQLNVQDALAQRVHYYDAVVCGPGPGHPRNKRDIGLIGKIWGLENPVPILGICLGFQSLCLAHGADIKRLKGPQHGIVRRIHHTGEEGPADAPSIYRGVGEHSATLYQSLCADIGQDNISEKDWNIEKWQSTKRCPDLVPLAWVENSMSRDECALSGVMDTRVLVGVRHRTKPFWALQYHPESICTDDWSKKIVVNWFLEAEIWNYNQSRTILRSPASLDSKPKILLSQHSKKVDGIGIGNKRNDGQICHYLRLDFPFEVEVIDIVALLGDGSHDHVALESSNARRPELAHPDVRGRYSIIAFNTSRCRRFEYTIGKNLVTETIPSPRIGSVSEVKHVEAHQPGGIWPVLAGVLQENNVQVGHPQSPFWGGIIGYTTYELGLEGIEVGLQSRQLESARPDACFIQVEESLVVDHEQGVLFLQKLGRPDERQAIQCELEDAALSLKRVTVRSASLCPLTMTNIPRTMQKEDFVKHLKTKLKVSTPLTCEYVFKRGIFTGVAYVDIGNQKEFTSQAKIMRQLQDFEIYGQEIHHKICYDRINSKHSFWQAPSASAKKAAVRSAVIPRNEEYSDKVEQCQESIRSGDSYELCLTDQTIVDTQKDRELHPWELYKKLREKQPAPFASYMRLGGATFISASPERFLKWDQNGKCELRPMKGTVRKGVGAENLEQAQALLDVPKERAENLMIVDLVRHDLHGICGSGNVSVPKLMVVEEYQSVFQMISIVQGQLPAPKSNSYPATGLDVLATSLPPGSMTGAPKKRSCEILQEIEKGKERSLYSGVVGYLDFGGRGDWSVNIRCMFKWDDEDYEVAYDQGRSKTLEKWHIGAGGAVTILSTPQGETDEMLTKLNGTLGTFMSS